MTHDNEWGRARARRMQAIAREYKMQFFNGLPLPMWRDHCEQLWVMDHDAPTAVTSPTRLDLEICAQFVTAATVVAERRDETASRTWCNCDSCDFLEPHFVKSCLVRIEDADHRMLGDPFAT